MDELHVDLQKVISELAYGRRMSSEEMHAYYSENDCGPREAGGNKPDPLGLADKYETASRFIFRQAALGEVSIFDRRGLVHDTTRFPKILRDYELIPKETFIADCHFGLGCPPVLWAKHSLIFDGWFDPVMTEKDAVKLITGREWESDGHADRYRTGAPGRPSAIQFVVAEWKRRRDSGEAEVRIGAETTALHEWCRCNHPTISTPTAKTIGQKIREEFN